MATSSVLDFALRVRSTTAETTGHYAAEYGSPDMWLDAPGPSCRILFGGTDIPGLAESPWRGFYIVPKEIPPVLYGSTTIEPGLYLHNSGAVRVAEYSGDTLDVVLRLSYEVDADGNGTFNSYVDGNIVQSEPHSGTQFYASGHVWLYQTQGDTPHIGPISATITDSSAWPANDANTHSGYRDWERWLRYVRGDNYNSTSGPGAGNPDAYHVAGNAVTSVFAYQLFPWQPGGGGWGNRFVVDGDGLLYHRGSLNRTELLAHPGYTAPTYTANGWSNEVYLRLFDYVGQRRIYACTDAAHRTKLTFTDYDLSKVYFQRIENVLDRGTYSTPVLVYTVADGNPVSDPVVVPYDDGSLLIFVSVTPSGAPPYQLAFRSGDDGKTWAQIPYEFGGAV